jgi:uncharacterized coiled-coil protein SlyX
MSEQKPEKKVVSRTVAIAIGIIAIVLVVSLVGAMANYNSIINGKDNTITTTTNQRNKLQTYLNGNSTLLGQTQTWLNGNKTLLTQTQKWLNGNETLLSQTQTWLEGNITYCNSQITNLQNQKTQLENWLNGNETNYQAQIATLNAQISQLTNWLNGNETYYQNQITSLNSTITSQKAQITSLQSQVTNLQNKITDIENLSYSQIWVDDQTVNEPAGGTGISYYYWYRSANCSGYVSIDVISATAGAWTTVIYSSHGINYNVATNVGTSGIAYFPILPSQTITLGVGNGNLAGGATQTVTITYYY